MEERNWAVAAQLSGCLVAVLLPNWGLLGIIGPLVIWLVRKDESPFVADQSKEALNFQLTILIMAVVTSVAGLALSVLTCGVGLLLVVPGAFLVFGALLIIDLVLGILAGLAASSGQFYRYPCILRLVA